MPNYREVLELAERLLIEKQQMKDRGCGSSFKPDPVKAKIQVQEGFPYLRPAEALLNSSQVGEYFCRLLKGFGEINHARYESLENSMKAKGFVLERFLERLLQNQLSEQNLEEELGPEGSLLFFFLIQTLKPTFEIQAEQWRTSMKELSWTQGYCPFCGGFPSMGEIRKEGKRMLHCPLCATEWEYPRVKCPYCQNEDQEQLTYFQVEGEIGNRVDICLACRHYLKTIDSRDMGGFLDFEVEDYLTLHLDHLAQEEGFFRPSRLFVEVR